MILAGAGFGAAFGAGIVGGASFGASAGAAAAAAAAVVVLAVLPKPPNMVRQICSRTSKQRRCHKPS